MRLPLVAAGLFVAAVAMGSPPTSSQAAQGNTKLTIRAVGAAMEFRTMGLPVEAFRLNAGASRTFRRLTPGRYVVVQAPPIGEATQVGPDQWIIESGLRISCSDSASSNQYDLVAGQQLTCTFTVE